MNRGDTQNADVYTLGNFGTNNGVAALSQTLTIENTNSANIATVNFGSGAYDIFVPTHGAGAYAFNETAPNGAGLAGLTSTSTTGQWADIRGAITGDLLSFTDPVQSVDSMGTFANIAAGISASLAIPANAHEADIFQVGNNTFIFDNASGSVSLTAADALVEVAGIHAVTVSASHILTLA